MNSYAGFVDTVNSSFTTTDGHLRNQARDVIYRMGQISADLRSASKTASKVDFRKAAALSAVAGIGGLFGARAIGSVALGLLRSVNTNVSGTSNRNTPSSSVVRGMVGVGITGVGAAVGSATLNWTRNRVQQLGGMGSAELFYTTIVGGTSGMWAGIQHAAQGSTQFSQSMANNVGNVFLGASMVVGGLKVFTAARDNFNTTNCVVSAVGVGAEKTVEVGGGILGAKKGAAIGAKWGMALGPKGAIVGGLVGGFVGSEAGQAVGRVAVGAAQAAGSFIASGASAVGSAIASINPFRRR